MTVCLVSPAMVESTAGVAVVRLLSCSSGYALTVSGLPTDQGSPIVDASSDPVTCPVTLPGTLQVTIYGDLSYSPGIMRQSVGTSRVFD